MAGETDSYKSGMAGAFSASIDIWPWHMVWLLRILLVNMLMLASRTCSDMQYFELDFISHPEECNGENDNLGC